ncbi:MAG: HAD hydrolase-like protein [Chromatiales bacterium]|jgi:predicted HAD superfamily hydrolase|nr:HAD hydrolase-like protein [Chromatiales bacterium]
MPASLHRLLADASVLSLDIFDTAILRGVMQPVDLFAQIPFEAGVSVHGDFRALRAEAERRARATAWRERQLTEVDLDAIYRELAGMSDVADLDLAALMAVERRIERRRCRRNPFIHEIYRAALETGKRVVFVSDIYLDAELIRDILHDADYTDYERLFLSSELRKTKATGELYAVVLEALGEAPQRILHVGDNPDSDIRRATAAGITAWHYPKCGERYAVDRGLRRRLETRIPVATAETSHTLIESTWRALVTHHLHHHPRPAIEDDDAFWYTLGYVHVGMIYAGLVLWLRERLRVNGVERVYFLSRDGHVMQRAYELLAAAGADLPPASYLYASRRALNLPAIERIDETTTDFLVSGTSRLTVAQFLARIGLDPSQHASEIAAAGFPDARHRVLNGEDYGRLRALFRALERPILVLAAAEREELQRYFEQAGLLAGGHAGIVDIGWHGSLQHSLQRLLAMFGADTRVTGHYIGTFPPARRYTDAGDRHEAWLCQAGEPQALFRAIRECVEIYEWIFSGPHGSVIRFQTVDGQTRPVLENNANEAHKTALAQRVQAGALQFTADYLAQWNDLDQAAIPPALAIQGLTNLLRAPSRDEARRLGDLPHAEGFGDVYAERYIARPGVNPFNPLHLRRAAEEYRAAFWRRGYLKRLLGL